MRLHCGEDASYLLEHPIIQKHIGIIEKMANSRIFAVFYGEYGGKRKFYIEECCDNWFSDDLNIEDCKELAELFIDIADELKNNNLNKMEI